MKCNKKRTGFQFSPFSFIVLHCIADIKQNDKVLFQGSILTSLLCSAIVIIEREVPLHRFPQ